MSSHHLGTILELLETGECPADCRPALFEILQGDDPEMKLRALDFTPELVDDDPTALRHIELVEAAGEPLEVRARAALALTPALEEWGAGWDDPYRSRALSRHGYRTVQRRLEGVYRCASAPKLVRRRVLETSVRSPEPWHRGAVRASWNQSDVAWRQTAVLCMEWLDGFDEQIREALDAEDDAVVETALRVMGRCGDPEEATERLVASARDDETACACRIAAIEALRFVDSDRARRILLELTHSGEDAVAGAAAWALDEWRIRNGGS